MHALLAKGRAVRPSLVLALVLAALPASAAARGIDLDLRPPAASSSPWDGPLLAARRSSSHAFAEREGTFKLGGSFGMLLASGFTGLALRFQGAYALSEIDDRLFFDLAGHAGVAFASGSQIFELVPMARLRYQVKERFGLYGDAGFGLAIAHASGGTSYGYSYGGNTEVGAVLRFSGGLQYAMTPRLAFAFEPLGLNVYINGSGSTFAYSLLLGLLVKV